MKKSKKKPAKRKLKRPEWAVPEVGKTLQIFPGCTEYIFTEGVRFFRIVNTGKDPIFVTAML